MGPRAGLDVSVEKEINSPYRGTIPLPLRSVVEDKQWPRSSRLGASRGGLTNERLISKDYESGVV